MPKSSKTILSVFTVLTVLVASVYFLTPGIELKAYDPDHALFSDANTLEDLADLIIVGELSDDFSSYEPTIIYNLGGAFESFRTVTEVKYSKVLKGNPGGETIQVIQAAALVDNSFKFKKKSFKFQKDMLRYESFTPMEEGKKYLLFLKRTSQRGVYSIISLNQGKFNIDNLDLKEKKMAQENTQYNALRESVINKFKSEFDSVN